MIAYLRTKLYMQTSRICLPLQECRVFVSPGQWWAPDTDNGWCTLVSTEHCWAPTDTGEYLGAVVGSIRHQPAAAGTGHPYWAPAGHGHHWAAGTTRQWAPSIPTRHWSSLPGTIGHWAWLPSRHQASLLGTLTEHPYRTPVWRSLQIIPIPNNSVWCPLQVQNYL